MLTIHTNKRSPQLHYFSAMVPNLLLVCSTVSVLCVWVWRQTQHVATIIWQFKKEERRKNKWKQRHKLLPPFLNNPLISVAGKQSAMNR